MLHPSSFRARASRRGVLSLSAVALPLAAFALKAALLPAPACAAPFAADNTANSAYNSGWADGSNGGSGFMPWILGSSGNAGRFISDSNTNGGGGGNPGINTGANKAFGLYGTSGGQSTAQRGFGSALSVGDAFNLAIDNGYIENSSGSVGFSLVSGTQSNATSLFTFMFVGGQNNYSYTDGATSGNTNTSLTYTSNGINTSFKLNSPTSYTFTATRLGLGNAGPSSISINGTIAAGQSIAGFRLFNNNANANNGPGNDYNFFANNMEIVPEPGTLVLALPVLGFVGAGAGLRRRRRAD